MCIVETRAPGKGAVRRSPGLPGMAGGAVCGAGRQREGASEGHPEGRRVCGRHGKGPRGAWSRWERNAPGDGVWEPDELGWTL